MGFDTACRVLICLVEPNSRHGIGTHFGGDAGDCDGSAVANKAMLYMLGLRLHALTQAHPRQSESEGVGKRRELRDCYDLLLGMIPGGGEGIQEIKKRRRGNQRSGVTNIENITVDTAGAERDALVSLHDALVPQLTFSPTGTNTSAEPQLHSTSEWDLRPSSTALSEEGWLVDPSPAPAAVEGGSEDERTVSGGTPRRKPKVL